MTQLVLLGTGTPNILPDRFQSAYAVIVDQRPYLVDCGGGTLQRIVQARAQGLEALAMTNLTRLFLTHLHPDHTTGLADLIIAPWVLDRTEPLQIYGPPGTRALCDHLLQAYAIGIAEHRDGLAPINHPLSIEVTEVEEGVIYKDDWVSVKAFRVEHGTLDAFGYQFATDDRTIVFSGDTRPTQSLIENAVGCDILVHEVYSAAQLASRPPEWQHYHTTVHTSAIELARIANQTQPELLVLTHQLFWGADEQALLDEVRELYPGKVVSGKDLDIY
ncbi:MAG: MBL fold metallo-hydrolase [Anaerolineae bacterium]|nr:MBL fold metallo-hydrolase [Anaerolineae bacterium]